VFRGPFFNPTLHYLAEAEEGQTARADQERLEQRIVSRVKCYHVFVWLLDGGDKTKQRIKMNYSMLKSLKARGDNLINSSEWCKTMESILFDERWILRHLKNLEIYLEKSRGDAEDQNGRGDAEWNKLNIEADFKELLRRAKNTRGTFWYYWNQENRPADFTILEKYKTITLLKKENKIQRRENWENARRQAHAS